MDRVTALAQLPTAHAVALRLREHGVGTGTIADALAIPPESVPHVIAIAEAKLERLLREPDGAGQPEPSGTGRDPATA